MSELNEIKEVKEVAEKTVNIEEIMSQIENLEASMIEAVKAGSEDMAEYYKGKIEQMKEQLGNGKEVSFKGTQLGFTESYWAGKAAVEGDTIKGRHYLENAKIAASRK